MQLYKVAEVAIIAILVTFIGTTLALLYLYTPPVKLDINDAAVEEKGVLLDSDVIAAYRPGDTVYINFVNYGNTTIYLPSDAPWRIDMNTSDGWITIYIPPNNNTEVAIGPNEGRHWKWNQTFDNGSSVPEGYYRIVFQTTKKEYTAEFFISWFYSKIDWVLIADILNDSIGDEKIFEVIVFFKTNITDELISEMVQRIGNFTIIDDFYKEYPVDYLGIRVVKSQIISLAEWDLVRHIVNNTIVHTLPG